MNNRKVNIILGIAGAVLGIVSVLTMLATCFGVSDSAGHSSSLGTCYNVAFGAQGYSAVPLLVIAFVLQIVGCVLSVVGGILPGKIAAILLGVGGLSFVLGGIFWFMAPSAFLGINDPGAAENVILGTGSILTAVFSLGGGLVTFYTAFRAFRA